MAPMNTLCKILSWDHSTEPRKPPIAHCRVQHVITKYFGRLCVCVSLGRLSIPSARPAGALVRGLSSDSVTAHTKISSPRCKSTHALLDTTLQQRREVDSIEMKYWS